MQLKFSHDVFFEGMSVFALDSGASQRARQTIVALFEDKLSIIDCMQRSCVLRASSRECHLLCTQAEITDFLPYKAEPAQLALHATMTLHLDSAMLSLAHDAFDYLIEDGGLLGAL